MASAERTSTISSLRKRLTAASTTGFGTSTRAGAAATTAELGGGALGWGRGASAAPGVFPPKVWRLPNISGLLQLQQRAELQAPALCLARGFRRRSAGHVHADHPENLVGAV